MTVTQSMTLLGVFLILLQFQNCSKVNPVLLGKPTQAALGQNESIDSKEKFEKLNSAELAKIEQECLSEKAPNFSNVLELKDMDGAFTAIADHFSKIKNMGGTLVLKASEPGAQIDQIADFGGKLVLCGFSVKNIENTNGKIIVVDGQIQNLKNHEGNVLLVRSNVVAMEKLKGLVLK